MLPKIGPMVSHVIGGATNFNSVQNALKKFDGAKCANAVAALMITSICLKDGVGCGMYVYQSLNNDKIPEKRRKFVASMDFTNGALMILTQIAAFFGMKKLNEAVLYKFFNKTFDESGKALKALTEKIRVHQKIEDQLPTKKTEIATEYQKFRKFCLDSIGNITNLVAATIVAKRIVVPFIATPLASKVEKQMNKYSENPVNKENKIEPTMQGKIEPENILNTVGTSNLLEQYKLQHIA